MPWYSARSAADLSSTAWPGPPVESRRWSSGSAFAVRWVCSYALLRWVPLALSLGGSALAFGYVSPLNWWGGPNIAVGLWVLTHVFRLPSHGPTGFLSGNNLAMCAGMVTFATSAAVIALIWGAIDPDDDKCDRRFARAYTLIRYLLALSMLMYAWSKVLPVQFDTSFDYVTKEVGQHVPRDLLWAFMGGSRFYQLFAGGIETLGALLLLTRRTAALGAFVCAAAIVNIVALDIGYDVPGAKFIAMDMLLMSVVAVAPHIRRVASALVPDAAVPSSPRLAAFEDVRWDRVSRMIGMVVAMWVVVGTFQATRRSDASQEASRRTPLYGIWDVVDMTRGGITVPLLITDGRLWRRFVFQSRDAALIFPMTSVAPEGSVARSNPAWYSTRYEAGTPTVTLRGVTQGAQKELRFEYSMEDADHLVIVDKSDAVVVRLRRFDPATYTLFAYTPRWTW